MEQLDRIGASQTADRPQGGVRAAGLPRARALAVAVAAAGAALATGVFAFVLPQIPARLEDPSAELLDDLAPWRWAVGALPVPHGDAAIAAVVLGFAALAFVAYGTAVWALWDVPASPRRTLAVAGVAIALAALAVLMLPTAQSDVYDYIAFGREQAVHGANPYEVGPGAFPADPSYPYANPKYRDRPDNKLPAWMLVNRGLASAGAEPPLGSLLLYRSALAAMSLASLGLVWLVVSRVAPPARLRALAVWGWNPVVVIYAPGKTDSLMVLLFLAGTALLVRERRLLAAIPLALSVFVKLITLPLVALEWLANVAGRRWKLVLAQSLVLVAVAAAVYAPYGGFSLLADHLGLFGVGGHSRTGAPSAAQPALSAVPRPVLAAALLVAVVLVLRRLRRATAGRNVVRAFGPVAVATAVLLVDPNSAWYLMTLIAVASLAQPPGVVGAAWLLTFGAFTFTLWQASSTRLHPLPDLVDAPRVATYLVPLALAAVAAALYARRRRARASASRTPSQT